jgi:large subunit ribosomal protein L10
MKKKDDKQKDLEFLRKEFEAKPSVFVNGFQKLTVAQDFELRKTVRGAGGQYKVVKNNIARKATEGTSAEKAFSDLAGMTSIAFGKDPVALAKALTIYAKTNPSFTFKTGFVEGRVVNVAEIQELSSMPSREELLAKVLFLINTSAQRLVTCVNGVGRNLAVVLDQAGKEEKFKA